jgi:serine/threonine protein kinase
MGEVYRARDNRLNRTVAIKVLLTRASAREELRQRFEREARAVSSLNHPHICSLYDIGSQDGLDYLVMEYLEGETLGRRLKRGPLPLDQVLRYAVEIGDALDLAHRSGLIHRDLKPGNIMLTKSGSKLLDFGLAKVVPGFGAVQSENPTMTMNMTQEGCGGSRMTPPMTGILPSPRRQANRVELQPHRPFSNMDGQRRRQQRQAGNE